MKYIRNEYIHKKRKGCGVKCLVTVVEGLGELMEPATVRWSLIYQKLRKLMALTRLEATTGPLSYLLWPAWARWDNI